MILLQLSFGFSSALALDQLFHLAQSRLQLGFVLQMWNVECIVELRSPSGTQTS